MPADSFICGTCNTNFSDIDTFVAHKKEDKCQPNTSLESVLTTDVGSLPFIETPIETLNAVVTSGDITDHEQQTVIIIQPNGSTEADDLQSILQGTLSTSDDGQTTFIPNQQQSEILMAELTSAIQQAPVQAPAPPIAVKRPKSKPRQKKKPEEKPPGKPSTPEIGADGKLLCTSCKRTFTKERHFNTHKCMGQTDYIDLTKKEALDNMELDDDELPETDEDEAIFLSDEEDEYVATVEDEETIADDEKDETSLGEIENSNEGTGEVVKRAGFESVQVCADPDIQEETLGHKPTDLIEDMPIFTSDEEKLKFEQTLNVDLSGVDTMFKQHLIEQDLNDKAPVTARVLKTSLSLYSCNVCDKIFKTLSHMRFHCLTHTDLKPFKCPRCPDAFNSKGNLYTHMRKHTGQYFRCNFCKFKSVNKSHLLEHIETHNKTKEKCELCHKTYKTHKSLINHIRKYHGKTSKGKAYLAEFLRTNQGQTKGATVIHQCHVCNRKFKKKVDRDRHLFVHDIKDIPNIQHCELCDYTASRKVYLDKHYEKHRVIYRCVECSEKFLSTVRLIDHLTSVHLKLDPSNKWEELFEKCINYSVYLPEPDDALNIEFKDYVNLPPELSSSSVLNCNEKLKLLESDLEESAMEVGNSSNPNVLCLKNNAEKVDEVLADSLLNKEGCVTSQQADVTMNGDTNNDTEEGVNRPVNDDIHNRSIAMDVEQDSSENLIEHIVKPKQTNTGSISIEEVGKVEEIKDGNEEKRVQNDESDVTVDGRLELADESGVTVDGTVELADLPDDLIASQESQSTEAEGEEGGRGGGGGGGKTKDIIKMFSYLPMTMDIFHKMRETFGNEECEYCGKLYYNKVDFDTHLRTHTGDKPFPCTICNYRGLTKENLTRHHEREHQNITFSCSECEFIAHSRSQLWNHTMKHRGLMEEMGIECPSCKSKHDNLKKLKMHFSAFHPDLNLDEQLKMTGFTNYNKNEKTVHRAQGKMGRRSYKCPYCEKVFIRANSELQKHIWIHEGIKPYKCPVCPHACRSKNNLQAHMLRHSNEKPYTCSECGKAYKSQTALRWHVRSHKDGKLFKCEKCPYEATQRSHLKRHSETHDVVKRFVCMHCDYSANTIGYMKIHYTRNHKGEEFVYSPNAAAEKRVIMVDSQSYRCVSCDYLFGNLSDLKRHLKIRHHVQVSQMQGLDGVSVNEVQVVQCTEEVLATDIEQVEEPDLTQVTDAVQQIETTDLDEKTQSAVNILQQIIDMSQQGALGQQQITLQAEDGQMVTVNPETIIVQQGDGEEMLLTNENAGLDGNQQYVIQYVTPDESQLDQASMVEVQTMQMEETSIETVIEQMEQSE